MRAHENTLNYPSNPSIPLSDQHRQSKKAATTMAYENGGRGDVEGAAMVTASPLEGGVLPPGFLTFDMVQERLVEAMITCWRHPDRERGWQRIRSAWPEILREKDKGDYDARGGDGTSSDVALRPASQTRAEIADMEEAFGWASALSCEDRRLVGLVITTLARGRREVSWRQLLRPMGRTRGADGLRMQYGRAIHAICAAENSGCRIRQTI
ncbi:hypothetical protein Q5H91_04085 [Sphingomonas sp. KR1UV-12]|uniref:Myb-like domain-containing protein n=1 Tax=Sphingomonas aurea TaxID=3063994 RepID=A0ABT9EHD4_9SPHN|nr:hypothetical protein [Sphingomonas sp. KR1UV-12]MDP1026381.1 hypothetical protein [Sphingomonas sp. KR1UV-12]